MGSSPRVRGKPPIALCDAVRARLIPACAGKTRNYRGMGVTARAHPRVCGENTTKPTVGNQTAGSSPRVRGKRESVYRVTASSGLIPACAGKTKSRVGRNRGRGAHPRVCGENSTDQAITAHSMGSSPRVRGKPSPGVSALAGRGLIPACAGKTLNDLEF